MKLIQVRKNHFINADKLASVFKEELSELWHVTTEDGRGVVVDTDYEPIFLNHLNAINENISTVK